MQSQNLSAAANLATEILSARAGGPTPGRPTSLLTIISTIRNRSQQADAVHAYWRLTEAIGVLNLCLDEQRLMSQLRERPEEAAELRTAQAITVADLSEASLQLVSTQHDLAARIPTSSATALPWPSDSPYVGAYRTYFDQLFGNRPAPEKAVTINQTLPLRLKAIDAHSSAVVASDAAFDATRDQQGAPLHDVIRSLRQRTTERRAFWSALCHYNHDIADYALAVVSPNMSPEVVVGTLIRQGPSASRPAARATSPRAEVSAAPSVVTSSFNAPVGAVSNIPGSPAAMPITSLPSSPAGVPGNFTPSDNARPIQSSNFAPPADAPATSSGAPGAIFRNTPSEDPPLQPPAEIRLNENHPNDSSTKQAPATMPPMRGFPRDGGASDRTTLRPIVFTAQQQIVPPGASTSAPAGYPNPSSSSPSMGNNANDLVADFFNSDAHQGGVGQVLSLQKCIAQSTGQRRQSIVHAYWSLQQCSAALRICGKQQAEFEEIASSLTGGGLQGSANQLLAKAALLRALATKMDAEVNRTLALCALFVELGESPSNQTRLLTTMPFTGKYPAASPSGAFSGDVAAHRLNTVLQMESATVDQAAQAVTASNQLAQTSLNLARSGQATSTILDAIEQQAETSLRFVAATVEYNQNIAEFAARTSSGDRFVAALMVR